MQMSEHDNILARHHLGTATILSGNLETRTKVLTYQHPGMSTALPDQSPGRSLGTAGKNLATHWA